MRRRTASNLITTAAEQSEKLSGTGFMSMLILPWLRRADANTHSGLAGKERLLLQMLLWQQEARRSETSLFPGFLGFPKTFAALAKRPFARSSCMFGFFRKLHRWADGKDPERNPHKKTPSALLYVLSAQNDESLGLTASFLRSASV